MLLAADRFLDAMGDAEVSLEADVEYRTLTATNKIRDVKVWIGDVINMLAQEVAVETQHLPPISLEYVLHPPKLLVAYTCTFSEGFLKGYKDSFYK